DNPFSFLRATFYRWIQLFNKNCENIPETPVVLCVGDLHVENFGTWRDLEGRLIWGVNDFDEAYMLPYTNDLIRLTTSAHLAIKANHLKIDKSDACESILEGYKNCLDSGGRAFVLNEEKNIWLHDTATFRLKDPVAFWEKLNGFKEVKKGIQDGLINSMLQNMPGYSKEYKIIQRIAGLGSLGRQRFVLITEWEGGKIAREAKAFIPSACVFAEKSGDESLYYDEIIESAVRCKDPFVTLKKNWIIRRISPDCSRIELNSLPKEHDEKKLLYAMGWETGNIHLGSVKAIKAIKKDLGEKHKDWLHEQAEIMLDATEKDFKEWQEVNSKS
ncbi:MAG: DUF2252 family protein, partial [Ignavibacteria bacterium]